MRTDKADEPASGADARAKLSIGTSKAETMDRRGSRIDTKNFSGVECWRFGLSLTRIPFFRNMQEDEIVWNVRTRDK